MHLDAHEKPPPALQAVYKKYKKATAISLENDSDIVDFVRDSHQAQDAAFKPCPWHDSQTLQNVFQTFMNAHLSPPEEDNTNAPVKAAFESLRVPGKHSISTRQEEIF